MSILKSFFTSLSLSRSSAHGNYLLIFLLMSCLQYSLACSCMIQNESPSIAVPLAFEDADAVFVGEVVATSMFQEIFFTDQEHPSNYQIVTYKVLESFKGVDSNYFITITPVDCCVCGWFFDVEDLGTYLIYTYGEDESGYSVSWCSRTHELDEDLNSEDLEILRSLPTN